MAMQINISPFAHIVPKVYAYTTPEITRHDGWTKIGYTEQADVRERLKQQAHTVDVRVQLEWFKEARYNDSTEYFKDHDFHDYLERFQHIRREPKTEWFNITPPAAEQLFDKFAAKDFTDAQKGGNSTYILRAEQQQAVEQTLAYYHKCQSNKLPAEYLWNAKPRFGKTLTAYDLMRKMDACMVLVVTNRPAIANSWFDDFAKFIAWQTDYKFVSTSDSLSDRATLSREQFLDELDEKEGTAHEPRMLAFISLQDLKGSIYFGGYIDKLKWVADNNWDLLIIDEAHEGVDTYKTDRAFEKLHRKFTLHLSGTPFKAIANNKFSQEQIFNWTFTDEQKAKESWQQDAQNPYACMPRMNMYTYQMSQIVTDRVNRGMNLEDGSNVEFAFDLNEFFSTDARGSFVHKKEVAKFLDALITQEKFPFSSKELREELKHTFWLLERVASAKALAKMLKEHPVFENYEIIVAAGDGRMEDEESDDSTSRRSLDKVRQAIEKYDKTITISVGQLTTGVTIPEWTAVFMLSNMKSPAEYIQAAFRAQNPYSFTDKDGRLLQKENAYIFDFSPERTLIVFDQFANSLYTSTSGGNGTKEEREANIKRLLNFFAVYAEDADGKMVELDAARVLTIPIKIKTEEVVRRGFMSNFLFNIGNVYNAPREIVEIIQSLPREAEQGRKKDAPSMDDIDNIAVDEHGEIAIPQETVINKTNAIFGEKIYEEIPVQPVEAYVEVDNMTPEQAVVKNVAAKIAERLYAGLYGTQTKQDYNLTQGVAQKIEAKIAKDAAAQLQPVADDFAQQKKILAVETQRQLEQAQTAAQAAKIEQEHKEKLQQAEQDFNKKILEKTQQLQSEAAQQIVTELETKKEEARKRAIDGDIREHLRGFSRTIPSFIMAYGDDDLCLQNFDTYPTAKVFEEVTSISVERFRMLRDGCTYTDQETGETREYPGCMFDSAVFDASVKEFMAKKRELANYFAETSEEDIFDYIPPQKTNQIFTPKRVVQMMVDQLVATDPHIFESPDKTFVDFYMKSGLYITEIVKRLYRNKVLQSLIPDDHERVKHILECQVFGFAPTQIIYDITMSYIFGFDEAAKSISKRNFFCEDTLDWAQRGELQKLVNAKLGDRT